MKKKQIIYQILKNWENKENKNLFQKSSIIIRNKIIKQETNNNNNDNKQIKKVRNPGIGLVRLLTMYLIRVTHSIGFGNPSRVFYRYEKTFLLIQSFIDWQNNAFILISGIVVYKTNKYSNLLYLWLIVLFYSARIYKYVITYKKRINVKKYTNKFYNPVVFNLYRFFTTYFVTYLFLPVINKGISQLSKYEFRLLLFAHLVS